MIHQLLLQKLDRLALRHRLLRTLQWLSLVWLGAALAAGLLWLWKVRNAAPATQPALVLGLLALAAAIWVIWKEISSPRSYAWLAKEVESAYPELRTTLLAAVEQRPESPSGEFGYLQTQVIREALLHAHHHRWTEVVSQQKLLLSAILNVVLLLLCGGAMAGALLTAVNAPGSLNGSNVPWMGDEFVLTVEPGDVEVERGTSLVVLARIRGRMPAQATLVYQGSESEEAALNMPPSLQDPIFSGRIPLVETPLEYYVKAGEKTSPRYQITVFEYPRLEQADVHLLYPAYTGLAERLIQDVRTVSVVEGTAITLRLRLNKPVASAILTNIKADAAGEEIVLKPNPAEPLVYEAQLVYQQSRRLKLELIDDAGRKNQKQEQFTIHVLPNQAPTLKPIFPARDIEVSALEEINLKVAVSDDFGVERVGLNFALAGQPEQEVLLSEKAAAKQKHELSHLLRLEELQAAPDQLLSYYWWVEDFDAQGQLRRTPGDMYFAEVRPFEEIFRQGEQPTRGEQQQQQQNPQGQGQNAQDAQQLAKLQKDIINATWKLIRRASGQVTEALAEDVEQVTLSQAAAQEKATALGERLQDEQSQAHLEEVLKQMEAAQSQLKQSQQDLSPKPLTPALAAEQAAYQALLKLRAREHEVVRQQQQQGQQSSQQSSSRSQQQREQMQQLDLRQEENRYETQRTAQEQQQESAEDRENRQVLNRLRELAQRQHDLNDRVKELQAALEEAQSKPEKEEIRKQLQRLQEEQRQILQDTDELQSRLDQPENQERMNEERQQLDETRDQVRRASESLQQERVGQAAAAGAKAEQQFENLREEFRRRASQHFNEEMQQMRDSARNLEEKEREIADQIREAAEPKAKAETPSLRDDADRREPIAQELGEQRKRLATLQDQMRDTIERAEATEPLLTERLYDTTRKLRDQNLERTLQSVERAVRLGQTQESQKQEAAASEGLKQLREGIERAAEGVLGDETEALRRAREDLQRLSQELKQEVERNSPQEAESAQPSEGSEQETKQGGKSTPGQTQQGQPQAGKAGKGKAGEANQPGTEPPPGKGGKQPGKQVGKGGQPGQGQPMNEPGEEGQPDQAQSGEQPPREGQPGAQGGKAGERGQANPMGAGSPGEGGEFSPSQAAPLTGENFREWSDRLRDVEEMVGDPQLRADAGRIRETARAMRAEFKRHSAPPNWGLVRDRLVNPLAELELRVAEEVLKRTSKKALVPLDRDPVPPQYSEKTRKYYDRLGSGK